MSTGQPLKKRRPWLITVTAILALAGLMAGIRLAPTGLKQSLRLGGISTGNRDHGLLLPSAATVLAALPELRQRPVLLEFRTRLCLDCQQLAPLLQQVAAQHPHVTLVIYGLDTDRSQRPLVYEAFQPLTVPTLVALNQAGHLQRVLNGVPTQKALDALFIELTRKSN